MTVSSCNELRPRFCSDHAEQIAVACHDLDKPPGAKILFLLDGRVCFCICGGDDVTPSEEEIADDAVPDVDAESLSAALSERLGVTGRLPDAVVVAALVHPRYHRQLVMAREQPDALARLLAAPPRVPAAASIVLPGVPGDDILERQTGAAVLRRASAAALRWSVSGFALVDEQIRTRRLAACAACPHLVDPPRHGAHRVTNLVRSTTKICGLCGCVTRMKARLASESCPGTDPANPSLTRWGEPRDLTATTARPEHLSVSG